MTIEQVKQLRVQISAILDLHKNHNIPVTYYTNFQSSLMMSKAWLGKMLGCMGYKNDSKRKDVKDIEPEADVNRLTINEIYLDGVHWTDANNIQRIDWLREEIKRFINQIEKIERTPSREMSIARTNIYNHLSEARFYLGFELGEIRDKDKDGN